MTNIICIDPGFNCGFAVFSGESIIPTMTGVINAKSTGTWPDRQTQIIDKLEKFLDVNEFKVTKAYIELPTMFQTATGMSCATGKGGGDSDLVKLSVLVGRLYELFYSYDISTEFIQVNLWKGTLPKKVVSNRIQQRLALKEPAEKVYGNHACDAVGLGLFIKGVFSARRLG